MREIVMLCVLAPTFSAVAAPSYAQERSAAMDTVPGGPTVTVVYDNRSTAEGLEPAWGFASIVAGLEKTILFDTGGDGSRLLNNMTRLGFTPQDVDVVVLSHAHGDHTGGLAAFLEANSDVTVYILESFPRAIREEARRLGAEVIEVHRPVQICAGAMLTGELVGESGIPEQSLLLLGSEGAAVITGCAHPGIVSIVGRAKALTGGAVLVALGGFHLARAPEDSIRGIIRDLEELEVRHAIPCHCSGDTAIDLFADAYGEAFERCAVGTVVAVGEMLNAN